MSRGGTKKDWVVMSNGRYVRNLILIGRGADPREGGYTRNPLYARVYKRKSDAVCAADFVPNGVVREKP